MFSSKIWLQQLEGVAQVGVIVVECMCRGIKCVCVVESMYVLWNASFGICYAFSCIILAL